ncbi:hypothetical protein N7540_002631 [Penicillium herquei]|nr:hypothetical protein N7540_002631 [Penicillium herquei]
MEAFMVNRTTTSIKFGLPPLELFSLPPSQLHKPTTRLPLPPSDTTSSSVAKFFQPFTINGKIFDVSLDPRTVLTFVMLYATIVLILNQVNAARHYRPWNFSRTFKFKAFVIAHNVSLATYSAWTLCGISHLIYRNWPSAAIKTGPDYYAHLAEVLCEVESSAFLVSTNKASIWEGGGGYLSWIFYMSKFYEAVDTLILLARGKKSSTLQTYHHAGVIIAGWTLMRYESPVSFIPVVLNSGIHALLYLYFTLQGLGVVIPVRIKRTLTSLQLVQFFVGMIWLLTYLFMSYKVPTHMVANPPNEESGKLLHLSRSKNQNSSEDSHRKLKDVASDGTITCLSDSGEVFGLTIGLAYLIPLILLFLNFFVKTYVIVERMPVKRKRSAAKQSDFLAYNEKILEGERKVSGGMGRKEGKERAPAR